MIYIVLPAYNEEKDLGTLLERVQNAMESQGLAYRVLVVNDGSQDGTLALAAEHAQKMPLEILDHGVNKGLGQALLTGLRRGDELARAEDIIVTMDADNTHDPALIGQMAAKIAQGNDVVIASRYEKGGQEIGLSYVRHILSGGASFLLRLFFPIAGARDYTCGYRAYRGEMLRRGFASYGDRLVEERGFTCMAEVLIKMKKLGAKVGEVPLVLRYDFKSGPSKMKFVRTIVRYGALIARQMFQPVPTIKAPVVEQQRPA